MRGLWLSLLLAAPLAGQGLDTVLGKMDEAAASFQSLTAHIRSLKHTDIVKDDSVDEGTIWVKRAKPKGNARFLIEFAVPDKYYVLVTERKAEVYRPKIAQVEEYDVSKYRDLAQQVWPFGTSGRELAARYRITAKGAEAVGGAAAVKLELIPKSEKLAENIPRIEMWISTQYWQPVQQKYYDQTPGDFRLVTYTDVKMNTPVPDSRLQLPLAAGVRRAKR
jgi:outer membrane lipoprotein-sorting protein